MNRRDVLRTVARAAAIASVAPGLRSIRYVEVADASARGIRAPSPPAPSSAAEITHGPTDRPNVALTFHGQGTASMVDQLLGVLAAENVQVTVLAVGSWLVAEPVMARRILDAGHELGNHTQRHLALAHLPAAQVRDEIAACATEIKNLTGTIGAWFRPSQIHYATPLIREEAASVGYSTCLSYDVDSLDYTDPGPAAITRTVLAAAHHGAIISMHFGHAGTIVAMPSIIDGLRRMQLSPVTATELVRT